MNIYPNYKIALNLFEKQIQCIIDDDKNTQMKLYDDNLLYEFPFANDRPKIINGKESFRSIMEPLWEDARKKGVKVVSCKHEFHATDEEDLFVAIFILDAIASGIKISLPFVQLIRIKNNLIIEVREFANPSGRNEFSNKKS